MLRTILAIVVGVAIGYFVGFNDAQKNTDHIVKRVINNTGGGLRGNVSESPDAQLEKVSR